MYNNQRKKQIKISLIPIIITLIIITLIVQAVLSYSNISMTSIIAGKEIAKNKITQELDEINWIQDVDSRIGSITIEDDGKTVAMTGNWHNPGKNAIYYIPEHHQIQTFGFSFEIEFGDSFNAAGVLLRVKKDVSSEGEDILKGYMLSFNNAYEYLPSIYGAITIWKFTYTLNDNLTDGDWAREDYTNGIQKTQIKSIGDPVTDDQKRITNGSLTVESNLDEIIITGSVEEVDMNYGTTKTIDVNETIDISSDDDLGDGFGFFSDHYAHGCLAIGQFSLTNFALTTVDIEPHNLYIDPNGGTWNDSSEVSTLEGENGDEVEIPLPTRPGYNFAGWTQTGNSGSMSSLTEDAIYTFGEDAETDDTLIAQWTKIEVEKSYNIDTGEVRRKRRYNRTSKLRNRK